MSPTPDRSDARSTKSSSSSKVLSAKFDSLQKEWDDHETDSPIKTVTIGGKRDSKQRSSSQKTTSRKDEHNPRSTRSSRSLQTSEASVRDDDSVGSVSTLGSTESVFERLYNQRKPSSIKKGHREFESRIPASSAGSVGSAGKYRTPLSTRMRQQSGGTKNRKNRLGAYSNSSALETKSVGYQDSTPRRRTTTRKASHRKDASSVVSALSAESEDDNSVFRRLYRNEKRTEKLWKVPDDASVASTPARHRRTTKIPTPSPIFDRLHRNEKRTEKVWKAPDEDSVTSTPLRRTRTALTKPSPVFERLYRNERRSVYKDSDDASVGSTVSRRSRTDDFDPNPAFARMYNIRKQPETRIKSSDDSSVCSFPSVSSRTEDSSYYDANPVFTTLYRKAPESTSTSVRRKKEVAPSPVFDRLYRSSPKRPLEKPPKQAISPQRTKEVAPSPVFDRLYRSSPKRPIEKPPKKAISPQRTPAQHRRDESNPLYDRLYSNQKRTEKLWRKPKAFVPSASPQRNHKTKERTKSVGKIEQSSPVEDEQKYLQDIIQDKVDDDDELLDQLLGQESPFGEEQKYFEEIIEDSKEDDEDDLHLLDDSPNKEQHLSGLKILTNDDLEVIDELERFENFYEGCTPTVALTSVSSSNWDESPDTRRQSSEGQPASVPETNAKEGETFVSAESGSAQSDIDEQKSLDLKKNDSQAATKQKCGDDDTSGETPTSTTYCVDYGDSSYRSFSTGNNVNEDKLDRRRTREQIGAMCSPASERIRTPPIIIQSAYRVHRAELELASAMMQSWDADVKFQNAINSTLFSIYRERALQQAILAVRCWWILEGLRIEDDWITLAWENEVYIGDDVRAQVNLSCEAKTIQRIFGWEPTKVAALLAKVVLSKAIEREQATERVESLDDLNANATKLQRWFRRRRHERQVKEENEQPMETIIFTLSEDEDEEDDENLELPESEPGRVPEKEDEDENFELPTSERGNDSILSSWDNVEEEIVFDPSPTSASPSEELLDENTAAIKIQSFFRLAILKSAIRELPSTATRLESVLETTGPRSDRMDGVLAARKILLNSAVNQQIISEEDFISQRAAALAINNIVQTYVTGLKKFREKKRATLIQAVFRGYRTRKRLEVEELSAVVIQFAWSERRYIKIKEKSATKIQGLIRMYFCRRSYEMNRFCIVTIQSAFRRAIATQRLAVSKSSVIKLQSTWRAYSDRKRYGKIISAIQSVQNRFTSRRTITAYNKECQAATILQIWWRSQSPRKLFLESVTAATLLQSHVRSYLQCRKFRKVQFDSIMIQRWWRAHYWTKRYESQKRSAICLQTFYRTQRSINIANVRRRSVLDIQRVARGFLDRQKIPVLVEEARNALFIREQKGAICIQKIWRMSIERKHYILVVRSTILLQRVMRGSVTRSLYGRKVEAVRTIQSNVRRFIEESRRQKANLAAIQIQGIWRGALAANYVASLRSKKSTASTVTIQSAWRCAKKRWEYMTMRRASIIIQTFYRKRSAIRAKRALIEDRSIILIQSQWRGAVERENFTIARISAIMIQASVRRMLTLDSTKKLKRQNALEHHASTTIQSYWRGAVERENFTIARISAIMIQASARRMLTSKSTKEMKNQIALEQDASTLIQSHWRRMKANEDFEKARISAIMIQAYIRRMLTLKSTKELSSQLALEQEASTFIQSHWRRAKANEEFEKARVSAMVVTLGSKYNEETRNQQLSKSSIVIQARWRGAAAREAFALDRGAAITIQSFARRMFAVNTLRRKESEKQFKKATESCVKIQAYWRKLLAQKAFTAAREASTVIQSYARMMLALGTLRMKQAEKYKRQAEISSIRIQAWWRVVMERRAFIVAHGSAIIIQSNVRRWRALRYAEEAKHIILATKSSVKIQACWRAVMAQETFLIARGSAIMIQASVRMMLARRMREVMKETQLALKSSTRIQAQWRSSKARDSFRRTRGAAIMIQASVRMMLARRTREMMAKAQLDVESSTKIQAHWRGSKARDSFNTTRGAAIIIQSCGRRTIARKMRDSMEREKLATKSSTKIQARWRGAMVRNSVALAHDSATIIDDNARKLTVEGREKMTSKDEPPIDSIITIQTFCRMTAARHEFIGVRESTIKIQAVTRRMIARRIKEKLVTERMASRSSVVIQSKWREFTTRSKYDEARSAAIIIQAGLRRMSCSRQLQHLKTRSRCSVVIQSYLRGAIERDRFARSRDASIMIQSSIRRMLARSRLIEMTQSSALIQKSYRGHIARCEFHRARSAAICIQDGFRSYRLKSHHLVSSSAVVLQSSWRMTMARSAFLSLKSSAVSIQKIARGYIERERSKKKHAFAVLVQSYWRSSKARENYVQCRGAIIIIQAMIRGESARSQFRSYQRSAICIQRSFREILTQKRLQRAELWMREATASSILIQSHWRGSLARDKYMQSRVAAMIIQSTIRGARVRSQWGFVRLLSTHKKLLNESARKIQLAYIAWKVDIELWELRSLAVLLQRGVRGQLARSAVQYALMQINASRHTSMVHSRARLVVERVDGASSIGSWHKAMSGTRVSAAIIVQSFVRRFLVRKRVRNQLRLELARKNAAALSTMKKQSAAFVIQRHFLTWSISRHSSAIKIQKLFRRWMACKHVRMRSAALDLKLKAATKIQTLQRRRKQEHVFVLQKQAILMIQSAWRGKSAKMLLENMKALHHISIQTKAAVRIQATQRRRKLQQQFLHQKQSILKIQCLWRKKMANMVVGKIKAVRDIAMKTKAAIYLQTLQRSRKQERLYQLYKQSILKIQCLWRKKLARLAFDKKKTSNELARAKATTTIQSFYRCRSQKQRYLLQKQAIIKIQGSWRRKLAQLALVHMKHSQDIALTTEAAVCIQSFQRRHKQQQHLLLQKQAILKIQCLWRRKLAEQKLADMRELQNVELNTSATCIQTFHRSHKERQNYLRKKRLAISVQNVWRLFSAHQTFLTKKTAASLIQHKYRGYKRLKMLRSVVKIQSLYRKRMARKSFLTMKDAASRIQLKHREKQRREALRKERETLRRRMELDFKQALSEMRIASLVTAEGLLTKNDSMQYGPFLRKLAARVHSTLNEAALLVNEGTREMIRIDPFATDNASSLKELEFRVQCALNEAASLSNEDIWEFVSREPLEFPLPTQVEKFDLRTLFHTPTKDKGTPVRSNKGLSLSDSFEEIEVIEFSPEPSTAKSESKPLKPTTGILKSSKDEIHSVRASVMSPLADLMREARAARTKNQTESVAATPRVETGKTPTKDTKPEKTTSPKNFGDATMPSPIRPQEDWDWASEW